MARFQGGKKIQHRDQKAKKAAAKPKPRMTTDTVTEIRPEPLSGGGALEGVLEVALESVSFALEPKVEVAVAVEPGPGEVEVEFEASEVVADGFP